LLPRAVAESVLIARGSMMEQADDPKIWLVAETLVARPALENAH
jgi:hypothetical protein